MIWEYFWFMGKNEDRGKKILSCVGDQIVILSSYLCEGPSLKCENVFGLWEKVETVRK